MCESREREEGKSDEGNKSVNPRGKLEAGLDQVQEKCPLRRESSNIIRITTMAGSSRPVFRRSRSRGSCPGHQSFCQEE